ncbi:hypothetical protein V495_07570 [Pseudogymnoascus sp. VKM F-4514 (FW-929)]|nr:hypothetical protein V495_07570 [Pseudogymnoascus sp. VKM F-4514 (FW-929)]
MDPETKHADLTSSSETAINKEDITKPQNEPETAGIPLERRAPKNIPGPPPEGGLEAWLQVVGAFSIMVATWGLVNTYGVYQTYYQTVMLTSNSASSISWIGSLQACLLFIGGLVSGPLFDAGYFRAELIVGLFLICFGMFMTSLCTSYWQVILAQGVCVGLGMGLTFLPAAGLLAQYFQKRRAFALGIGGTGSPIGGIIFPIIFSRLEPSIGFGWATRVIALESAGPGPLSAASSSQSSSAVWNPPLGLVGPPESSPLSFSACRFFPSFSCVPASRPQAAYALWSITQPGQTSAS